MELVKIYKLIDPETREIIYIGQSNNVERRLRQHCDPAHPHSSVMYDWLCSIKMKPIFEVIEETTKDNGDEREKHNIKRAWSEGQPLLNNPVSIGVDRKVWRKRIRDCKWNQLRKRLFYFGGRFDTNKELGFKK